MHSAIWPVNAVVQEGIVVPSVQTGKLSRFVLLRLARDSFQSDFFYRGNGANELCAYFLKEHLNRAGSSLWIMKKALFLGLFFILVFGFVVYAKEDISLEELNVDQEKLSLFLAQVPGLSPNERISVYVTRTEATPLVLSFRLEEGKVADIALKEQENWTLKAETSEETLNKILASEDPATTALAAINSKDIRLNGRTVGKKIKLAFLRMGLKLAGIFG